MSLVVESNGDCPRNLSSRNLILTFKEGRTPDAYEMSCDSVLVSKGRCGTLVVRGENQCRVKTGDVAQQGRRIRYGKNVI